MPKIIQRLPDSELELMKIIWRLEPPVTRAEIEAEMPVGKKPAPTTTLTLLTRLFDKGFLGIGKYGNSNFYVARVSEREYLAAESRGFIDRVFGGKLSAFAVALMDSGVSRREIEELKELLEKGQL